MIDPDKRNAIFQLHQEGMSLREISRRLHVSRHTVRTIIRQQGKVSRKQREDKIQIDPELLRRLYRECNGWMERMHEKLVEEEKIEVGYSTLTRMLRKLGLGRDRPARCDRVPDEPGAEMQHDTTVYQVKLAEKRTKVIASLIYLRYSKRRYLKFYRVFNRFAMKCFLHEALMFWGYVAWRCIIDNTNLARLRGAGSRAVICPEMNAFSRRYGFQFVCHEIGHANRKAGNERSFWTVETSFLPGRTFDSLEDLNKQAREWATERMEYRPQSKARLIPAKAFEHECGYLHQLPQHLPAPYRVHQRGTDQYGYVALGANYYWVPGSRRDDVKVLEYADHLRVFLQSFLPGRVPTAARRRALATLQSSRPTAAATSAEATPARCPARGATAPRHGRRSRGLSGLRAQGPRHPAASIHSRTVCPQPQGDQQRVRQHRAARSALSHRRPGHPATHHLAVHQPIGRGASRGGRG